MSIPRQQNDVNTSSLLLWPLVIVLEDSFRPESARMVVEFAQEISTDTGATTLAVQALRAREEISAN